MIQTLYQLTNKGSFRALSFVLALILTATIFLYTERFALDYGGISPIYTLIILERGNAMDPRFRSGIYKTMEVLYISLSYIHIYDYIYLF